MRGLRSKESSLEAVITPYTSAAVSRTPAVGRGHISTPDIVRTVLQARQWRVWCQGRLSQLRCPTGLAVGVRDFNRSVNPERYHRGTPFSHILGCAVMLCSMNIYFLVGILHSVIGK